MLPTLPLRAVGRRTVVPNVHLFNLSPAHNSQHSQKRLGRGRRSGLGKTSGRGHKGQKARAGNGKPRPQFEGGQTPIVKLIPKRGFTNPKRKEFAPVNLDRIQHWIETGRLTSSPEKPITARELLLSGCIHDAHDGVKLLGDHAQELKSPVWITPSRASKSAIQAVEAAGGAVICRYYNELALRDCVKGRTDRKAASPTVAKDLLWYTNWDNRGYLAKKATAIGLPLYVREQAEEARQVLSRGPQSKRATIGSGPSGVAAAAAAAAAAPSVTVDATAA